MTRLLNFRYEVEAKFKTSDCEICTCLEGGGIACVPGDTCPVCTNVSKTHFKVLKC